MSDLNIALIMRLVDKLSGPAKLAADNVERMGHRIGRQGVKSLEMADRMQERTKAYTSNLQGQTVAAAGMAYSLFAAVKPAIAVEEALAKVRKVANFEDANEFDRLGQDIARLATEIPMATGQIAKLVEGAAQANVVDKLLPEAEQRRQLIAFARDAGQIGVAFDMSADAAAGFMTSAMNRMQLSRAEAVSLADAVNHLSNNMAAEANQIASVIGRQGAVAVSSGLAKEEVAALSAVMIANAESQEIAATAMKNFLGPLTAGAAATDKEKEAFQSLGFEATELAKRMQEDAKGAIMDVLDAISQLSAAEQPAMITTLFGEESKGVVSGLLTNLKQVPEAFELVSDKTNFAGSALEEFLVQSQTTANNVELLSNKLSRMTTTITGTWLPVVNQMADALGPIINQVAEWAALNPELTQQIGYAVFGLVGFKLALVALKWAFVPLMIGATGLLKLFGWISVASGAALVAFSKLSRGVVLAFTLMSRGIAAAGAAMLANPIILAIATIAAGAYLIYRNWDGISTYFDEKMGRVRSAFERGFGTGIAQILDEGQRSVIDFITWFGNQFNLGFKELFDIDLAEKGRAMMESLKTGIMAVLPSIVSTISSKLNNLIPDWVRNAYDRVTGGASNGGTDGELTRSLSNKQEPTVLLRSNTRRPGLGPDGAASAPRQVSVTIGDTHHHYPIGIDAKQAGEIFDQKLAARNRELKANLHDGGAYAD